MSADEAAAAAEGRVTAAGLERFRQLVQPVHDHAQGLEEPPEWFLAETDLEPEPEVGVAENDVPAAGPESPLKRVALTQLGPRISTQW